jgi:hypothetical protein
MLKMQKNVSFSKRLNILKNYLQNKGGNMNIDKNSERRKWKESELKLKNCTCAECKDKMNCMFAYDYENVDGFCMAE